MEEIDTIGLSGALRASASWVRMARDAPGYTRGHMFEDTSLLLQWLHDVGPAVELEWIAIFDPPGASRSASPRAGSRKSAEAADGGKPAPRRSTKSADSMLLRVTVIGATASDRDARLARCVTDIEDLLGRAGGPGMGLQRIPMKEIAAAAAAAPTLPEWAVVPLSGGTLRGVPHCEHSALRAAALRIAASGTPIGFRLALRSDAATADVRAALEEVDARLQGRGRAPVHPMLRLFGGADDEDDLGERVTEAQRLASRVSLRLDVLAPNGLRTGELLRVQEAANADLERSSRLVRGGPPALLDGSDHWARHLLLALIGRDAPEPPSGPRRRRPSATAEGDEDIPF